MGRLLLEVLAPIMRQEPTQIIEFELTLALKNWDRFDSIHTHVMGGIDFSFLRMLGEVGCCLGDVAADDKGVEVVEDCPLLDSRVMVVDDDQTLTASGGRFRVHDPKFGKVNLDLGFRVWGLGFGC